MSGNSRSSVWVLAAEMRSGSLEYQAVLLAPFSEMEVAHYFLGDTFVNEVWAELLI